MNKKCLFAVVIMLMSLTCLSACGALRNTADKNKALNESLPYYELNAANYDEISYNGLTYTITDECLEMSELQEEIGQVSKLQKCGGGRFQFRLRLQYCRCGYKQCRSGKYQQRISES